MKAQRLVVLAGAIASAILLFAARRAPPTFLLILFIGWVMVPFVFLTVAGRAAMSWPNPSRTRFGVVSMVFAVLTPAIYAWVVFGPYSARPVFIFVVLPPVTLTSIGIAALIIGRARPRL